MNKEIIIIKLDYLQWPIWINDQETGQPMTGVKIVNNDEHPRKINYEMSFLYSNYYEFDSHDRSSCSNEEQEKKDKDKMLFLLKQLNDRLNEFNNGSFEIEDLETHQEFKNYRDI